MVRRHPFGRWVWVLSVLGVLLSNSALAGGLRCAMPDCGTCYPAPFEQDGCCEPVNQAPRPCGCELTVEPRHDAVIVAKVEVPSPEWAIAPPLPAMHVPRASAYGVSVPVARPNGPPDDPPDRRHAGRAPPAS